MKKKKAKRNDEADPRLHTPPGHYLKNAPWRREPVEEPSTSLVSAREGVVLAFLVLTSVAVAAALWMNPPAMHRFKIDQEAVKAQATLAGNRVPRPYNGLGYDPAKFEEVKEDDPIIQDDLEDVLIEEIPEAKPAQTL